MKRLTHILFTTSMSLARCTSVSMIVAGTLLLVHGSSHRVYADYIEPGEVEVKTERYVPTITDFDRGTYVYQVDWQGIPVAKAEVQVGEQQHEGRDLFRVKATANTASVISIFYRLRFTSESIFETDSFKPIRFFSLQKENSRERLRDVRFEEDGTIRTSYIRNGDEKEPLEFQSENYTFDPISAAFLARSLPLEVGARKNFDVFNGKHRYLISFEVVKRERIRVAGKPRDAYKVVPGVQKLTDSDGENRLKEAAIWISADDAREVLKLESSVFVGNVNAELVTFKPDRSQTFRVAKADDRQEKAGEEKTAR